MTCKGAVVDPEFIPAVDTDLDVVVVVMAEGDVLNMMFPELEIHLKWILFKVLLL